MMPRLALRLLLPMLALLLLAQGAYAACTSPAGTSGDMTYSTSANVMAYCDGTNWISMAGGVSLTVNTSGGVTPYGTTGDIQINNGGALGGDTGNFKYSASTLSTPIVSASTANITTVNSAAINNTGLGTFGSILDNGGLTVLGAASMTTVSATAISGTIIQVGNGGGASCVAGINGALKYDATSNTIAICMGTTWTSLASGTITGSGVSGGSATAIAFWNGPTSLTYESATTSGLYWDHANGILGVGTNAPSAGIDLVSGKSYIQTTSYRENPLGGGFIASHARGTQTSPSVLVQGDTAGTIYFKGYDGGAFQNLGSVQAILEGTPVSGMSMPGALTFVTVPSGSLSGLERVRIASSGNVGIGTASPSTPLQVSGTAMMNVANLISQSVVSLNGGSGNMIASGSAVVSTSSAGSVTVFTNGNQRMVVGNSGYVGIGSAVPNAKLTVEDAVTDYTRVRVRNTSSGSGTGAGYYFGNVSAPDYAAFVVLNDMANTTFGGAGSLNIYSNMGNMTFGVNVSSTSTERMRLDTNGNLQIGTTATYGGANARLTVSYVGGGTQHGLTLRPTTDTTNPIDFLNSSNAYVGSISQNTTTTTYNTTSDRRMKEDITNTREGLQKLMLLPVRDFAFKADPSHTIVTGFIAQELEKVFPEAVTTNGDDGKAPLKDKSKPWSVDYGRVTPLIVRGVQDLKLESDARYKELKADNDNLRRQIDELRKALRQPVAAR